MTARMLLADRGSAHTASRVQEAPEHRLLTLQRQAGNAAVVQRFNLFGDNIAISDSVGAGGANLGPDVGAIQLRLVLLGFLSPLAYGAEMPPAGAQICMDSSQLKGTIAAISAYQKAVLGFSDGRVDVGGKTFKALKASQLAAPASEKKTTTDTDTEVPTPAEPLGDLPDSPAVTAIAQRIAALKAQTTQKDPEDVTGGRNAAVDEISAIRTAIAGLSAASLGLAENAIKGVRGELFRRLNAATPYYSQIRNHNLLFDSDTTGALRTCNVTSISMALEGLGKNAADFADSGALALIKLASQAFAGVLSLTTAEVYKDQTKGKKKRDELWTAAEGSAGTAGPDLNSMRLPDFLQLVAVYIAMCYGKASERQTDPAEFVALAASDPEAFRTKLFAGRDLAVSRILAHNHFPVVTEHFGVKTTTKYTGYGKDFDAFGKVTRGLKKAKQAQDKAVKKDPTTVVKTDAELRQSVADYFTGKDPKDAERYAAAASEEGMESRVPIAEYRGKVLPGLQAEFARGNQIIAMEQGHFTRLESVTEDEIVLDDPASETKKNLVRTWESGRAIGLFSGYFVLSG